MELLTGKAKEDFLNNLELNFSLKEFVKEFPFCFDNENELFKTNVIVEYFDSVGIYISVYVSTCRTEFNFNIEWEHNGYKEFSSVYNKETGCLFYKCKTRQEATTEAIKKANEIYNNQ